MVKHLYTKVYIFEKYDQYKHTLTVHILKIKINDSLLTRKITLRYLKVIVYQFLAVYNHMNTKKMFKYEIK